MHNLFVNLIVSLINFLYSIFLPGLSSGISAVSTTLHLIEERNKLRLALLQLLNKIAVALIY